MSPTRNVSLSPLPNWVLGMNKIIETPLSVPPSPNMAFIVNTNWNQHLFPGLKLQHYSKCSSYCGHILQLKHTGTNLSEVKWVACTLQVWSIIVRIGFHSNWSQLQTYHYPFKDSIWCHSSSEMSLRSRMSQHPPNNYFHYGYHLN